MKSILISLLFVTINSCGQVKEGKKIVEEPTKTESIKIKKSDDSQNITMGNKNELQKSNLKITFEERLNIPKEMIEKMPTDIQSEFKNLINNPIIYFYKYDGNISNYTIDDSSKYTKSSKNDSKKNNSFSLAEFSTYMDYKSNLLVIKSSVVNNSYLINKNIIDFKWKISSEKKKIGNYLCTKASTIYKGEKIIAYFTDEIPFSIGPSIYLGLPGLIVYLEAPDRTYTATKIETFDKITVEKLTGGKVVSEKEYSDFVEKNKDKPIIEEKIEEYHEN